MAVLAVASAVLLVPAPGTAKKRSRPASCEEARLVAVGGYAQRVLKCEAGGAARGKDAAPRCLALAQARALLPVQKFDPTGLCLIDPRTLALIGQAEEAVQDIVALVRPDVGRSPCAARKLKAVGAVAGRLLATRARLTRVYDPTALTAAVIEASVTIVERFAAAERRSCPTVGDAFGAAALVEQLAGVSGSLAGRLVLTKTIEFPETAWPEAVANAATFEALGFTVAIDGSSLAGAPQAGGGWLVVLGDQRTRTDASGAFQLDVPSGSPVEGQLFHPSNADQPMARFLVTELGTAAAPGQLDVELVTQGRCGMNVNPADDSAQCGGAGPAVHTTPGLPRVEASVLNPDPTLYPPQISGELGTYPNPDPAAAQVACLDYNGFVETGERGDTSLIGAVSYPGSTCHYQVEIGCCDNEAATIRRRIANLFDEQRFPVLACFANHLGRLCQQITSGDIAARSKGMTAKAGERADVYVEQGEKPFVDVHNNGCYGATNVTVRENGVGGVLVGAGFDGARLEHHDGEVYWVDREIQYWAPVECPPDPDAVDVYDFEVDGSTATLAFHCVRECPPPPGLFYTCTTTSTLIPPSSTSTTTPSTSTTTTTLP